MAPDLEERLIVIEQTLWGRSGQNGVAGDVRALRQEFRDYVREEKKRLREEESDDKGDKRFRWTVALGLLAAAIGPLIGYALGAA